MPINRTLTVHFEEPVNDDEAVLLVSEINNNVMNIITMLTGDEARAIYHLLLYMRPVSKTKDKPKPINVPFLTINEVRSLLGLEEI